MARTTYEFIAKNPDMMNDINTYLLTKGFKQVTVKNERLYSKPVNELAFLSVIMQPITLNFSIQVFGKNVVVEVFVKQPGALGRELAIDKILPTVVWRKSVQQTYDDFVNYIENY